MAEYGRMDPFSFAGSKEVDHPVSIRMQVATLRFTSSVVRVRALANMTLQQYEPRGRRTPSQAFRLVREARPPLHRLQHEVRQSYTSIALAGSVADTLQSPFGPLCYGSGLGWIKGFNSPCTDSIQAVPVGKEVGVALHRVSLSADTHS